MIYAKHPDLRSIIYDDKSGSLKIIDQTRLPHEHVVVDLGNLEDCCRAIKTMQVRGAPLIGITAAFGFAFGLREQPALSNRENILRKLAGTRPTAVNLKWALAKINAAIQGADSENSYPVALGRAIKLLEEDIATCSLIGDHGLQLVKQLQKEKSEQPVNIITHCNAGWLATGGWGTALAPVYKAAEADIHVHVWVSETRPRNQGAELTAWELAKAGVPHTLIPDNAAGHLMQNGLVDMCIVGSDRTTANGDVCNKIGTYLKALAATANNIPFYAALPVSTIDWEIKEGLSGIPIEQRGTDEVTTISGKSVNNEITSVQISPDSTPAVNYAFDVTPAKYVSGLITEHGIYPANPEGLKRLKSILTRG
jgi:methylthioribose-1-phosphate isomerase